MEEGLTGVLELATGQATVRENEIGEVKLSSRKGSVLAFRKARDKVESQFHLAPQLF